MFFNAIRAQNRPVSILKKALERERVPTAYLFTGPPGCGRMMAALATAASLNCQTGHIACGECSSCLLYTAGNHPDLHLIGLLEGKRQIGIEQVRENIMERAYLKPMSGKTSAFIVQDANLMIASLTEIIRKEFAQPLSTIVLTGTHGKTTSSSLMAHVLETAGLQPGFLIGGIAENFGTSAKAGNGPHFVIEGDEYDSAFFDKRPKFLNYFPDYLAINNIEFDHADIYDNIDQIKDGFGKLMRIIPQNGVVMANGDDHNVLDVIKPAYCPVETFGKSTINNWQFKNVKTVTGGSKFDVLKDGKIFAQFFLSLSGEFQIYNALAVCGIAHHLGISVDKIAAAFATFKSVARRLDDWGQWNRLQVYDDFAHHPTAIKKTLQAIRTKHPGKKIAVLFEPRTNTTVKNYFQAELAGALSLADTCLITPIHRPERIPPELRLSLDRLIADLEKKHTLGYLISDFAELIGDLAKQTTGNDILVIMTNGNLGGHYAELKKLISGH